MAQRLCRFRLQARLNAYLYNNGWTDTGLQVSMNLLRLLQLPALNRTQESQAATDDARRVALSMAILTQVRVGALRYDLARREVAFTEESLSVDNQLLSFARAARTTNVGSELELIRAEGRYLLSRYQRGLPTQVLRRHGAGSITRWAWTFSRSRSPTATSRRSQPKFVPPCKSRNSTTC